MASCDMGYRLPLRALIITVPFLILGFGSCAVVSGLDGFKLSSQPDERGQGGGSGGSGGSSGAGGEGGMKPCTTAADCPGEKTVCGSPKCTDGVCGMDSTHPSGPLESQVYGDCKRRECDATGNLVLAADDTDTYSDGLECTTEACSGGSMLPPALSAEGTPCSGDSCRADGQCVECLIDDDCGGSDTCEMNKCVPSTCLNNSKDGTEGDIDCGGPCKPCADDASCGVAADCVSGVCSGPAGAKTCQPSTCSDSVKNGAEPDVDCGASCSEPCMQDQECFSHADCESGVCYCIMGECQLPTDRYYCLLPSCTDGTQNGDETGIDCGNPSCPSCPQ